MKTKAQALVIVILVIMIFLGLVWTIVFMLENESRWTDKEKRTTIGFHSADTAQSQAYWKVTETSSGWDEIINSFKVPTGFDGNTVFTTKDGSLYKIKISSGKDDNEDIIIIRTVGTDKNKRETRGIKTVYKRTKSPESAINVKGGVGFAGNAKVHWGAIVSKNGNITVTGDRFPRKFAGPGYRVIPRDSSVTDPPHIGPDTNQWGQPIEDEYKEWSSNGYRDADTVDIDLASYIQRAKSYRTPTNAPNRSSANPPNSGYYENINLTFSNQYRDNCSTATYYVKNGNVSFGSQASITPPNNTSGTESDIIFIVENGNISLPQTAPSGSPGNSNYKVKVPTTAWQEYQYLDSASLSEYPGDLGYRSSGGIYTLSNVVFHGLLYVGGNLDQNQSNKNIVGVVIVKGAANVGNGTLDYYYDKTVDTKVLYSGSKFSKVYWAEFVPGSFDFPDWSK